MEKELFVLFLERSILFLEEQLQSNKKGFGICRCFGLFLNQNSEVQYKLKLRVLKHLQIFDVENPGIILDGISNRIKGVRNIEQNWAMLYQYNWFNRFYSGDEHRIQFLKWVLKKETENEETTKIV